MSDAELLQRCYVLRNQHYALLSCAVVRRFGVLPHRRFGVLPHIMHVAHAEQTHRPIRSPLVSERRMALMRVVPTRS
jgi:hypothetical protein